MEVKELICVNCPMGCHVEVEMDGKTIHSISGYRCEKGKNYAEQEFTNPMRILTTTVKVHGGIYRVLPVITEKEIPLSQTKQIMEVLEKVEVNAPIHMNDVIVKDICGTGVDVIASRTMDKQK